MFKFAIGKKRLRMKKFILLSIIMVAISVANCNVGFAQTDNNRYEIRSHKSVSPMVRNTREASSCSGWGTFTNFSATDMNGGTHDIQSYLNQGKYVVIEFFCAWCSPCWQYYQGGTLEELYNTYGDGGTGEFVVLMVEGELTNTEAQITGTTTSQDYAGMSQGDFTNGGTNPIPIIDATENLAENVSLYEGSVPSVYLFCPSGYVFDVYDNGQSTANDIYNFATRTCPNEESLPDIGIAKPVVVRMGEIATFSSCVISLTDVTYAWTFEDGTPETSTDAIVDVVWDTPGMHRISLTVANVNGQVEHPDSVYVIDCSSGISTFPFVEDFESGQGCWILESANTVNEITIGDYSDGMNGLIFSSFEQANNYNQYFISPELHHTGELNLSFKYKKDGSQSTGENFYVKYSTTTSDISSFITLGSMITANSNSWETYTGTLPADAKYFMINYNTDYQYYLVVDDLTIERAAYWSCDFEGDETWTLGNDQQDGNVQWQILTPETYPSTLISGDNAYLTPFVFNGDTLNITPEHWALADLISQLTDFGGPGQVAESSWIEFSNINLTDAENPQITFRQIFKQLNGVETSIRVSTDGGQTWTDHIVNEEVEDNTYGEYEIRTGIREAAGEGNVKIRFLINSDAHVVQMGYGWEIDDIEIKEAPDTIIATAGEGGTISPSGNVLVDDGDDAAFTITPNDGYRIASVMVDETENVTDQLVDGTYTFVDVIENHTIAATFEEIHTYTIIVLSSNEAYGMVSGGGIYEEGTDVVIMAMPNGGYLFDSWEDGNFDNPRTITVTSDSTFVADFVKCEITQTIDTTVQNFVTVGDHTFYSTGNYSFAVPYETACDTIFDINLTVLAEPEPFDIGPNPTSKTLNINSEGFISYVEFYSPTGQLALRKEVNGNFAECDVESLVSGIYIIRIYGAESNLPSVYKVVKE